jgi:hypothetical protein
MPPAGTEPSGTLGEVSTVDHPDSEAGEEFLYLFGFESPDERRANESVGTDFESCGVLRIRADGELAAKTWGAAVAAWYVATLFEAAEPPGQVGWTDSNFATWIETDPNDVLRSVVARLPVIAVGERPDFDLMRSVLQD